MNYFLCHWKEADRPKVIHNGFSPFLYTGTTFALLKNSINLPRDMEVKYIEQTVNDIVGKVIKNTRVYAIKTSV